MTPPQRDPGDSPVGPQRAATPAVKLDVLEAMGDAFVAVDAAWKVLELNGKQARLAGDEPAAHLGRSLWELLPPARDVDAHAYRELHRAMRLRLAVHFIEHDRAAGTWREVDAYPTPEGGLAVFSRDATARKRAERALERSQFLASAGEDLASSLEYESTLARVANAAVPRFADWAAVDLVDDVGGLRRVAVAHADPERARQAQAWFVRYPPTHDGPMGVGQVLRSGEPRLVTDFSEQLLELAPREPDRTAFVQGLGVKSSLVVPLGTRGRIFGALSLLLTAESDRRYSREDLGFAQDLAHRASLAIESARLYREAQDASRIKDEFLAAVSHELRTPLTAILSWARALRSPRAGPDRLARAVRSIERNARSQAGLIDDLLDVSSIAGGRLVLELTQLDPVEPVRAAVEAATQVALAKEVELRFSFDPGLPPVRADRGRLQQVAWNLLSNAIRFTGARGAVRIALTGADGAVQLEVIDSGEGISAELLPHVFDGFRRGPTGRRAGSLGLGLAITKRVVEQHGGRIDAQSEGLGKGARFTVVLPGLRV